MELSIGDTVFYTRFPEKMLGFLHDGHVELVYDPGGVQVVNHRCPMDSISFGNPSLESPAPCPSIPVIESLRKFLWTPVLMEAPLAVAPQHDHHHIPQPEGSLHNGDLGD